MTIIDQVPHSNEVESALIGALFIDPAAIRTVNITPDDLYDIRNQEIFRTMFEMVMTGKPVDYVTLISTLKGAGKLEKVGGENYIMDTVASSPTSLHVDTYADQVRMFSEKRKLIQLSKQLTMDSFSGDDVDEIISKAMISLATVRKRSVTELPNAYAVALDFNDLVGRENLSLKTYIPNLDRAIGGYVRRTLNIIAARPSMGKSTLALQIARNWAANKKKVIYFSLEMPSTSLWARVACGPAGVPWHKVIANDLTPDEQSRLLNKSLEMAERYGDYLMIDDSSRTDSDAVWRAVSKYKPDAIVIDHSLLMGDKIERSGNEVQRIGRITWMGKSIAKEFNLVALYVTQLSRKCEERANKRPILSDLRDSGDIEQNADTVTFLYRDDYYNHPSEPKKTSLTELLIAKNRDGLVGDTIYEYFDPAMQWFHTKEEASRLKLLD